MVRLNLHHDVMTPIVSDRLSPVWIVHPLCYCTKTERRETMEIYVPNKERRKEEEDVETMAVSVRKESEKPPYAI